MKLNMIKMNQLREEIKLCLEGIDCFTTTQLKEILKERGYIYNVSYDVGAFSNAMSSLVRQRYIAPIDKERKGNYRVLSTMKSKNEEKNKGELKVQKVKDEKSNNERELQKVRKDIEENINEFCKKIEEILDSEKPSTYGRNRKTYNDILKLVCFLREFKFEVEE